MGWGPSLVGGREGVLDKSAEPLLKTNKQITSLCPVAVSSEHSRDFGLSLEQMANEHLTTAAAAASVCMLKISLLALFVLIGTC